MCYALLTTWKPHCPRWQDHWQQRNLINPRNSGLQLPNKRFSHLSSVKFISLSSLSKTTLPELSAAGGGYTTHQFLTQLSSAKETQAYRTNCMRYPWETFPHWNKQHCDVSPTEILGTCCQTVCQEHIVLCNKLCGNHYKAPNPPPLPKHNIQMMEPFTVSGIDFTGVLYIWALEGEKKAYIFLCIRVPVLELSIWKRWQICQRKCSFKPFINSQAGNPCHK